MRFLLLAAVGSVVALYVAMQYQQFNSMEMLVVFAADEVHGEMDVLMKHVEHREKITASFCSSITRSTVKNGTRGVLLVYTGIGPVRASSCVAEILLRFGKQIGKTVFFGTSGTSSRIGGYLQPEPMIPGDLCISYQASYYEAGFRSVQDWKQSSKTLHDPGTGFEEYPAKFDTSMMHHVILPTDMRWDVQREIDSFSMCRLNAQVEQYASCYNNTVRSNRIFTTQECAEVTGFSYWNGIVEDQVARTMVAKLLNKTAEEVVAFSAMEGLPYLSAILQYNALHQTAIQAVNIRVLSNYNHPRIVNGSATSTSMDSIHEGFSSGGYTHAIHTVTDFVLHLL